VVGLGGGGAAFALVRRGPGGDDGTEVAAAGGDEGHALAGVPAPDLHCIPLHGTPATGSSRGRVLLRPALTPFGVAVDRDGVHRYRFTLEAEGLPDPSELGDYDRYVAWLTPPTLAPMVRLGEVANGRWELDEAGLNTFLVLVSAEGPDVGDERRGPLVLRGASPSMVLRPHDLPYILAEMSAVAPDPDALHEPHGHHHPRAEPDEETGEATIHVHVGHGFPASSLPGETAASWRPPPMHPEVDMPAQVMLLRPGVLPFLPGREEAAAPRARPREEVRLASGDTLVLEAGPLLRSIGDVELPGYGFNGQIPGPMIRARQGSTIHVRFRNRTALPSAVHWHGIRLENPFDGVPGVTQDPVAPGEEFHYRIRLPDEGTYWYHPHLREDVTQDLGLAGNLHVSPGAEDPYGPVDHEELLLLDDHLIGPEGPVPYGREAAIHALMGRFGNVLLVNNQDDWSAAVRPGEVVRFHLTNAASTRTYNLSFGDLPMKLVAGDVGKLPRETWVESVVIAPAERWVVEVRFPRAGEVALENRVQGLDHMGARFFSQVDTLGTVNVEGERVDEEDSLEEAFLTLRQAPDVGREVDALMDRHVGRDPDRTLVLALRTRDLPFPLDPLLSWEGVFRPPVEWAGTMPDMDWLVSGNQVEWILREPETGAENMDIDWRFEVGDQLRLRLVNDRDALHPMQHPIHIHGQRFLVLAVNGTPNPHPTWKDTVLVPVGAVVDVLVEMSNPGAWMIHCHIAEHLETGMMAVFRVEP
jgi:suppressor of ftsI